MSNLSNLVSGIASDMSAGARPTNALSSLKTTNAMTKKMSSAIADLTSGNIRMTSIGADEIFGLVAKRLEDIGAKVEWNYGSFLGEHPTNKGWFDNEVWNDVCRRAAFEVTVVTDGGKEIKFSGHPAISLSNTSGYTANDFASDFVPQEAWDKITYQLNAYFTRIH